MKVIVTGATGFLGRVVCRKLKEQGYEVLATGRNLKMGEQLVVPFLPLDLSIPIGCSPLEGDALIHCAALSSPWGKKQDFYRHNVLATRHVIDACRKNGIRRLIHVSTPSIYFDFTDRLLVKEDDPLPNNFANHYAATKREAELLIKQATDLETITIRPRGLFGPGDTVLFPRLLKASQKGKLPLFRNGEASVDITYVDNVVDALLLCLNAGAHCLGKTYNITNGEPRELSVLLEQVCTATGTPMNPVRLPYALGYGIAALMEASCTLLPLGEPLMTRYTLSLLAKSQTLDITAAKRDLCYNPAISLDEGIERFAKWWRTTHDTP